MKIARGTKVFVLTGAGVSAESGVRTFRDASGLWEEHRVEDVASPDGWERDPTLVWRFYSERRRQARQVSPNPGHLALARLEAHLGDDFFLCTQNVDGLHEAAGSRRLVHMHGELGKSRCENDACALAPFVDGPGAGCHAARESWYRPLVHKTPCGGSHVEMVLCRSGGSARPGLR